MFDRQTNAVLMTPGPLTTSSQTKQVMLDDWGSRDSDFIEACQRICARLLEFVDATKTHACIPMQGSGTFAVEATLGTLIPKKSKSLVLINGAYGERIAKILSIIERPFDVMRVAENQLHDIAELASMLENDVDLTHVIAVHCETTSGILNPINAIADTVCKSGRKLIIDAMSSFGALELNAQEIEFDAVIASSNKCLEGVPGVGFSIIKKQSLLHTKGNSHSLSLDLFDQWQQMRANGQWRFTPPTHVLMALDSALEQLIEEGGVSARGERYQINCDTLIDGMRRMGFETLLPDNLQAPIIITFKMPTDPNFNFQDFYDALKNKGFVIYPGKLTVADSFRMGCIGCLDSVKMASAVKAVQMVLAGMGVASGAP